MRRHGRRSTRRSRNWSPTPRPWRWSRRRRQPTKTIRLLFDIQALQNPWSAERGIGRHVLELGRALGRRPELDVWFVLNRERPAPPATVETLRPYGRLAYSDDTDLPADAIYHVPSPFEPSPIDRIWPPELRSQPLAV